MIEHDREILGKSEDPNWRTPKALVDLLFKEFPIAIDLAACRADAVCGEWLGPDSFLGLDKPDPEKYYDALAFDDWAALIPEYSYGFLNPPYSRKLKLPIEPWILRCWWTALKGRGVIAVLPAAIQTSWWQKYVWCGRAEEPPEDVGTMHSWLPADEIRFFPHRVSFIRADGEPASNANVNTAVVIWRPPRPFEGPWTPHTRYWSYR